MRRNASAFLRILNRQNVPHSEVRFVELRLTVRFQATLEYPIIVFELGMNHYSNSDNEPNNQ